MTDSKSKEVEPSQLNVLIDRDGYLTPQIPEIKRRYKVYREALDRLQDVSFYSPLSHDHFH